jgi:hypothetical protein
VDRQVNVQGNGAVKARAVGRPDEEVVKKSSLLLHTFFLGGKEKPGRTGEDRPSENFSFLGGPSKRPRGGRGIKWPFAEHVCGLTGAARCLSYLDRGHNNHLMLEAPHPAL